MSVSVAFRSPRALRSSRPRRALRAFPIAALAAMALAAAPLDARADDDDKGARLAFSVTGRAAAAPDRAVIVIGVEVEGKTAQEAMAGQAERMTSVLAAAEKAGVQSGDIETAHLSLSPTYEAQNNYDGTPKIRGYRALNTVSVTLHSLDGVGAMLDTLIGAGADRVDGVRFEVADTQALEKAARIAAVEELRKRRDFYAKEAGFELGRLIAIQEGGAVSIESGPMMKMTQSATPVSPGDITAEVTLSAIYEIERD